jgi:hypothetical protein
MRNRHRNLINAAKGANFTVRIIFNPLRQLPLQAMQMSIYLGLDHGAKYFLSKQGMNDYLGLIYGTMWRNTDQWEQFGLKQGAKLMGVSEAEYTKFIDIYQRHGLPASVDSHMYAIFANVDRVVGKAPVYQGAVNTFNTFRKYARRIGFDAGEQFQLMGAFLAVRNKWMKNNPKIAHKWAEPGNIEKIFGEARVVSYNMNKTGAMQFQKGILGLIFQFQAHAVKSMQTLLPNEFKLLGDKTNTAYKRTIGKLSNKAFSDAEKARIAWQQFALFGTGAYGVGQMWDKFQETTGVDTPPEVDRSIREGITGTLLNMLFEAWNQDGEQMADIEFSGNAAPFSGISGRNQVFGTGNPIAAFLTGIVLEDKTSLEFGLGPSYALGKDVYEAWKFTTAALGTPFEPISGPEKGIVVANEWMKTFFPIYGNFMRGRVALELNRYVAATGDVGAEVTTGEAMALGTMGLNAHSNRWLQDELIQIKGLIGNPKQDKLGAEIDAEAANFYKFLKAHAELLGEGKLDPVEGTRLVELNAQMLSDALSDDEHRRFFNRVRDLILNDVTKDGLETQFINAVISGYAAYIPDIRDPEFINRIRSGPEFSTKEETIKFLEEMNQWQRIDQNPQM